MPRAVFRDDQWDRIEGFLPGKPIDCGVTARNNHLFVEAVLWIIRTGSPWRDLPDDVGHWVECMFVTIVGLQRVYGSVYLKRWPMTQTLNISWLTAV